MSEFLMPSLGADMESAVLMEWLVNVGDKVTKGQIIAELETSKGVIEIEVFEDGIIKELLVEPETECRVGTPLAIISTSKADEQKSKEIKPKKEGITKKRIKASPAARKRAKELGVELTLLSDEKKTLHLKDLETKEEKPKRKEKAGPSSADKMRDAIAAAMSRSNEDIPHYYLSTMINMSTALSWLEEQNQRRSIKSRILPAALLIRASVKVLQEVPQLNGFWQEGKHIIKKEIHPGVAIALRKGGLITPALLNAHELNLDETMEKFGDLINRTRSGKLKGSEVSMQSITITNLGDLGVEKVFGVIYPPQVAIIGFGKIHEAPWAQDDTISVRKVVQATLAGDHRATDGRTGALFLDKLDKILQNPKELL